MLREWSIPPFAKNAKDGPPSIGGGERPLNVLGPRQVSGESRGIPHLAKNERDVGHPALSGELEPEKHVPQRM
jgi:hypothetical protein